jgi:single-stranded-DNA-specific exonuclease
MKLKLLGVNNPNYSTLEQVLVNRKIPYNETHHYMNTSDADISDPTAFGDCIEKGAKMLVSNIQQESNTLVICDCDCDGFTAAALLINYLNDSFPSFVQNNLKWYVHEGKQHGLSDCMDYINQKDFKFIIVPDAGSNDYELHKELKDRGIDILVMDHHEAEYVSEDACVINNQLSDYPNKELSGVGVTWQFCRYLDRLLGTSYADYYIDLVALGNTGDMMSLTSIETKHLINKGFLPENIHNPYIYEMWQKNKFKLGEHITSIDAAFYIVPMINAVQRSGSIEEKELLFKSMLKSDAFKMIPSNKRGHKPGEEERLVDQAVRMSTNVKNRQTRTQDAGMELLEKKIEKEGLLKHKVLLFTLKDGQVDRNIAGLIANKLAAKYQRPCCVITETDGSYQGSARGYEISGLTNFKDICEESGVEWAQGHQNAFGVCIAADKLESFIDNTDRALADMSSEPVYYVDYIYTGGDVNPQDILTIGGLKELWGKDFNEAMVAIKDLKVSKDMVQVYRKSSNTLKITLPNKVNIMKFNATDEECEMLENQTGAYVQMDVVGTCHINEFFGNVTPQIFMEEYEITGSGKYLF